MTLHVVIIREPPRSLEETGGVEILDAAMEAEASRLGHTVHVRSKLPSLAGITIAPADTVVAFTQEEGRLSRAYRAWADRTLATGAWIIEKNIFALPSPWRPRHPRYVHALMSSDGAHRFSFRSRVSGMKPPDQYMELGNPLRADVIPSARAEEASAESLTILRVGRPDPIKWTGWELDFAARVAALRPHTRVRLVLVGCPKSAQGAARPLPKNLVVSCEDYANASRLQHLYAEADIYAHFSRIGETYGNTIAEAQACGLFCVIALDPAWDTAPLDFLTPGMFATGTSQRLLRQVDDTLAHFETFAVQRSRWDPQVSSTQLSDAEHLRLIADIPEATAELKQLPSAAQAFRYIRDTGFRLGGVPGSARGVLMETQRSVRSRSRI